MKTLELVMCWKGTNDKVYEQIEEAKIESYVYELSRIENYVSVLQTCCLLEKKDENCIKECLLSIEERVKRIKKLQEFEKK